MKKLFAILIALFPLVETFADESPQQEPKGDALTISTEVRASVSIRHQHAPANVDLFLLIEETSITIHFNGDFGTGTYLLNEIGTGNTIYNTVVATAGSSETIPFTVTETTSFNFYIEFEDGSWSQLSWGSE